MEIILYTIELCIYFFMPLIVFLNITGVKPKRRQIIIILIIYYLASIGLNALIRITNGAIWLELLYYYFDPIYLLLMSFLFIKNTSRTVKLFYGLFPFVLWNLFQRSISFFILPVFGLAIEQTNQFSLLLDVIQVIAWGLVLIYIRLFRYHVGFIRNERLTPRLKRMIQYAVVVLTPYIMFVQFLIFWEDFYHQTTLVYREALVLIYLFIVMGMVALIDKERRKRDFETQLFQQMQHIKNTEAYSHQIEDLYSEIRGFRHDYKNLLVSLRLGIEQDDMASVKEVYESVLKDSDQPFQDTKYDIGRLVHLKNDAVKSLLVSKMLRAQKYHVNATVEIPAEITPQGMSLADFITVISVLCDNAIEAAIETSPIVTMAYIKKGDKQFFIVENTTREEVVDTSNIFVEGVSSKGQDRGLGLANVARILDKYPRVLLKTQSQNHLFRQTLEIEVED